MMQYPAWTNGVIWHVDETERRNFIRSRFKVLYGGRGSSKSWTVAQALIELADSVPLFILCAREVQKSIKDSSKKLLEDTIKRYGLQDRFTCTLSEIRNNATGSVFIFSGLRDSDGLKSAEGVDICWIEEANTISQKSIDDVIPTIRKKNSEVWFTFNPDQPDDPIYNKFVGSEPPEGAIVKLVNFMDNPWFPKVLHKEMEDCRTRNPDKYRHIWLGECNEKSDKFIFRGKYSIEEFDEEGLGDPLHGLDFGFSQDPTAGVKCYLFDEVLYVSRECGRVGLELDDTAPLLMREIKGCERYVIRADSARPESISYLVRHGLPLMEGVDKWKGSVEDGIEFIKSLRGVVIHPLCTEVANEFSKYQYKVDKRTGDILPAVVDANNHYIDAIRYALGPMIKGDLTLFDVL